MLEDNQSITIKNQQVGPRTKTDVRLHFMRNMVALQAMLKVLFVRPGAKTRATVSIKTAR
jgi:hypothetical protein